MAAEILGGGVDDDIHPELEGALVVGGREGGVDQGLDAVAAADLGEPGEVEDAVVRVRRRLAHQRPRGGPDGVLEGVVVAHGNRGHLDPVAVERLVEELPGAAVAVVGHHHVGAARQHGEQRRRHRGHAAREEQAVLGALEGGELGLGDPLGRVAVAPVLHPIDAPVEVVLELLGVGKRVGRRLHDRGGQGVTGLGPGLAPVHGQGARPEQARGAGRLARRARQAAPASLPVAITTPAGAPARRGARWPGPPAARRPAAPRARSGGRAGSRRSTPCGRPPSGRRT